MDPFADFFQNRTAVFFLTLLTAGVILYPTINYQPWLASGDHGRDLYCFKATLDGAVPYRDYWWVYGPIMPYYYAVFLKFFGRGCRADNCGVRPPISGKNRAECRNGALFLNDIFS